MASQTLKSRFFCQICVFSTFFALFSAPVATSSWHFKDAVVWSPGGPCTLVFSPDGLESDCEAAVPVHWRDSQRVQKHLRRFGFTQVFCQREIGANKMACEIPAGLSFVVFSYRSL